MCSYSASPPGILDDVSAQSEVAILLQCGGRPQGDNLSMAERELTQDQDQDKKEK